MTRNAMRVHVVKDCRLHLHRTQGTQKKIEEERERERTSNWSKDDIFLAKNNESGRSTDSALMCS